MTREHFHDAGEDWDWEAQKADTDWVFRDLKGKKVAEPGQRIDLDIVFVPVEDDRGAKALVAALREAGYAAEAYEDEGEMLVEATAEDADFSFDTIWFAESKATRIALKFGYAPDGWGFGEEGEEE